MIESTCTHCGMTPLVAHAANEHPGLCCDCCDLSWGMPVEQINAERAKRGRTPIAPWPTPPPDPSSACLDVMLRVEERVVDNVQHSGEVRVRVMRHLEDCLRCRHLVAALAGEQR